jgi:transmembrane sensor
MSNVSGDADDSPASAEAWFARLRAGPLSAYEQGAFDRWLVADELNSEAFNKVSRMWDSMEAVRADPQVLAMREQALASSRTQRRAVVRRAAFAAAAIGALTLALFGIQQGSRWRNAVAQQEQVVNYETRIGQKSTITLADGSMVVLDTDSAIQAWHTRGERRIRLMRGRAFFDVAKDASRPFSVTAGANTVTAVGTEFDVELKEASMEVTLVSGKLRVRGAHGSRQTAPAPVVEMNAGQRLIAANGKPWTMRKADSRVDTGWLRGQLVFDEERLDNIATALNRYSTKKIVIPDLAVASRRLSAVLVAGDVDTFVQAADTLGLAKPGVNDARHVELVAP